MVITEAADIIVQGAVEETQQEQGKSVAEFTDSVEEKVQTTTSTLQEQYGTAVEGIVADTTEKTKSYTNSLHEVLTSTVTIADTASNGAAGVTYMGSREVEIDVRATDYDQTPSEAAYWGRVDNHEKIHQEKQAGSYNAESITYVDAAGALVTAQVQALIEWQPSSQANITSDLTSEYQQHVKDGDRLVGVINKQRVEQALKDGDMQGLQQEILEEQLPEIIKQEIDVTVGADVSS